MGMMRVQVVVTAVENGEPVTADQLWEAATVVAQRAREIGDGTVLVQPGQTMAVDVLVTPQELATPQDT